MKMYLKFPYKIINATLSLFFPRTCFGCHELLDEKEVGICVSCNLSMESYILEKDISSDLRSKIYISPVLKTVYGHLKFKKTGLVRNLLHALKYKRSKIVGEIVSKQMVNELKNLETSFDFVLPVPIHPKKLKERAYNQSEILAKTIADELNVPLNTNLLLRKVHLKSQTKNNRKERLKAMKDAFTIKEGTSLKGKHILLVDDMFTTGATIESCVTALLNLNPKRIDVVLMAFGV